MDYRNTSAGGKPVPSYPVSRPTRQQARAGNDAMPPLARMIARRFNVSPTLAVTIAELALNVGRSQ